VATPIGTLGDFSPRAREVLAEAALILVEDTRRAGKLLGHVGVASEGRLTSFHEHNEGDRLAGILDALHAGRSVVLMSDAGTPVLSDPGFVLVRAARADGLPVASVPGPSSFTAALAASGQPPLPATLVGFLPARQGQRRQRISEVAQTSWTLVILLSPHRLSAELGDLAEGLGGDRPATLLAELSKLHERAVTATLGELANCDETRRPRGEYVVVVGPRPDGGPSCAIDAKTVRTIYETALAAGMSRTEAMKSAAARLGIKRRQVFDFLADHEIKAKKY
jgi:16S rRNA (cytidine1402-2'-O)-methyltransferase